MKKLLSAAFLAVCFSGHAQDFVGYRTGNYTGVNGVFFNPANIADSRYRWDVNLVSVGAGIGNNQASFKLKDIFSGSFSGDSIKNKIAGDHSGATSGSFNMDIHGPSVMFNLGRTSSIALTSRARVIMNVDHLDGKLANQLLNDMNSASPSGFPYTIASSEDMRFIINGWSEFGGTYARVIADKGAHFLKGGLTLKYVAGVANAYIHVDRLNSTMNVNGSGDVYMTNTTGAVGMGFGGANLSGFDAGDLTRFKSSGVGFDLGFVYEFRPDYGKHLDPETGNEYRDDNKYKLKLGLALLDIGSVRYTRDTRRSGDYMLNITGGKQFYLKDLDTAKIDNYRSFFDSRPQYFTPQSGNNAGSYSVPLPSTLHLDLDFHAGKGLYVNAAAQFSLAGSKPFAPHYFQSFTLTPRFEGRGFGAFIPLSYSDLTKFNAGLSLRAGPLFVGSGSLLTSLFNNSKQADFFFGLHLGGLQKNRRK